MFANLRVSRISAKVLAKIKLYSMILRGPHKDIFMTLRFVWGRVYYIQNLAALPKFSNLLI